MERKMDSSVHAVIIIRSGYMLPTNLYMYLCLHCYNVTHMHMHDISRPTNAKEARERKQQESANILVIFPSLLSFEFFEIISGTIVARSHCPLFTHQLATHWWHNDSRPHGKYGPRSNAQKMVRRCWEMFFVINCKLVKLCLVVRMWADRLSNYIQPIRLTLLLWISACRVTNWRTGTVTNWQITILIIALVSFAASWGASIAIIPRQTVRQ